MNIAQNKFKLRSKEDAELDSGSVEAEPMGTGSARDQISRSVNPLVGGVESDTCESDASQMSLISGRSSASGRSRGRKQTQATCRVDLLGPVSVTTGKRRQKGQKRNRSPTGAAEEGSEEMPPPPLKVSTSRRGRIGTSTSVPQVSSRAEYIAQKRTEGELTTEEEVAELALRVSSSGDNNPKTTAELMQSALDSVAIVTTVATKSRNLKGTFVRALKDAAAALKEVVEVLGVRTSTDDNQRLQAGNNRLKQEVAELRAELAQLRADVQPTGTDRSPSLSEEVMRGIMVQVGTMVNARIEALEARLPPAPRIRPPLAVDGKKPSQTNAPMALKPIPYQGGRVRSYAGVAAVPAPVLSRPAVVSQIGKAGQPPKATPVQPQRGFPSLPVAAGNARISVRAAPASGPSTSAPSASEGWQTVSGGRKKRRNKGGGTTTTSQVATHEKRKKKPRKLQPPKSAAVVITVAPEAADRGLSYEAVLRTARRGIDVSDLGGVGARTRLARTGARILEFPGKEGARTADTMAERLRRLFADEDGVKIARPTKCAEVRVSGLDDSVDGADVRRAIIAKTACSPDTVKVGAIRPGPGGVGAVWAQCPVAAAKILSDAGRLLVGFSSAKITLLAARPMRCFRCMGTGHTRSTCPSEFDCSGLCFRCGKPGHSSAECSAAPHCPMCASQNQSADHAMGSGNRCSSASKPRRGGSQSIQAALTVRPQSSRMEEDVEAVTA